MFYPLFVDLKDKEVLVAGGGRLSTKRALTLRKNGARVTVASKDFSQELRASGIELMEADLNKDELALDGFFMLVLATDDKELNKGLAEKAFEQGVLVNRADLGISGDVIFPMVSNVRGHTLAYTTLGEDPKLLKRIKERIDNEFSED